ncbi:hypothetical protein S40293_04637 [Stachybotrys chartarum IBT 40293]|nr:hypothetical protein S40293_04637 [Stachybotrys chartarum IBT 40293]
MGHDEDLIPAHKAVHLGELPPDFGQSLTEAVVITSMSQPSSSVEKSILDKAGLEKSHELLTCTAKSPPFSYVHLELVTDGSASVELDNLMVKSYCTAALRQFLGLTGVAIPIDILKVDAGHCWLRVPQPDLGMFAAAITAWKGSSEGGTQCLLRVKQCSDWLGTMVGSDDQDWLWHS